MLNPFEDEKPSVFIGDIIFSYEKLVGTDKWTKPNTKWKKDTFTLYRKSFTIFNSEIYPESCKNRLLTMAEKKIPYKIRNLKIERLSNLKFSSKVCY